MKISIPVLILAMMVVTSQCQLLAVIGSVATQITVTAEPSPSTNLNIVAKVLFTSLFSPLDPDNIVSTVCVDILDSTVAPDTSTNSLRAFAVEWKCPSPCTALSDIAISGEFNWYSTDSAAYDDVTGVFSFPSMQLDQSLTFTQSTNSTENSSVASSNSAADATALQSLNLPGVGESARYSCWTQANAGTSSPALAGSSNIANDFTTAQTISPLAPVATPAADTGSNNCVCNPGSTLETNSGSSQSSSTKTSAGWGPTLFGSASGLLAWLIM